MHTQVGKEKARCGDEARGTDRGQAEWRTLDGVSVPRPLRGPPLTVVVLSGNMPHMTGGSQDAGAPARPCPACDSVDSAPFGQMNGWETRRCVACGLVYTANLPAAEELQRLYSEVYRSGQLYDDHLRHLELLKQGRSVPPGYYRSRMFLRRFKPKPGDRLLEVGCGVGGFLVAAKRAGWAAEGVDFSEEAVRISASVHGIPVHRAALEEADLPSASYAVIVCWEVLEHLVTPRRFMDRVRELLRPGGVFVCSVPNHSAKVPRFTNHLGPASLPPLHLNFWDSSSFRRFAEVSMYKVLYLAPKRILVSMEGARQHPARLILNQLGALLGIREGSTLYAILTPLHS